MDIFTNPFFQVFNKIEHKQTQVKDAEHNKYEDHIFMLRGIGSIPTPFVPNIFTNPLPATQSKERIECGKRGSHYRFFSRRRDKGCMESDPKTAALLLILGPCLAKTRQLSFVSKLI
jgi:hypothetical protein